MPKKELKQRLTISYLFLFIFGLFLPLYNVSAFTILSTNNYAWSDNVGWINFAPINSVVTVSDSAISGSAWSANKGFINFAPAQGGVFNDGTGNLSGSAWGEQLGYIDFNNVNINGETGKFSGTATGTLVGTITFDCTFCDVETDWRPASSATSSGGGSSGSLPNAPVALLPDAGPTPVGPTNTISPNIPDTGFSTTVKSSQGAPVFLGSGESDSLLVSAEKSGLFDVIQEPVQSTQRSPIPVVVFLIVAGTLLLVSALLVVRKK